MKVRLIIALFLLAAIGLLFSGCAEKDSWAGKGLEPATREKCYAGESEVQCPEEGGQQAAVEAVKSGVSETPRSEELLYIPRPYKAVITKPTGWFRSGQEADMILYATGFNESGGPLVLNHPGKVATDGKRLIVSDTWNNRVLVWNSIPIANNTPPDMVLGQPDFNSNTGRLGRDGMNFPLGISTDGTKLVVADAYNHRVLIWNEFPAKNNQPADLVLGASDFNTWPKYLDMKGRRNPRIGIYWPFDVWTDGTKLAVVNHEDSSILLWNRFPTQNNQPADLILGSENFSSRFSESNHSSLVKGSFETGVKSDGTNLVATSYSDKAVYVWNKFPTQSGEPASFKIDLHDLQERFPSDSISGLGAMGVELKGGKLFVAATHKILMWSQVPKSADELPLVVGAEKTRDQIQISPGYQRLFLNNFGRPFGVATDGRRLMVADTNFNRVLIFNEIPTVRDAEADIVLGTPELFSSRNSFASGTFPFSDGKRLIVGVDGFGVWIYDKIPDESKAEADVVVGRLHGSTTVGGNAITDGKRLIMVHREGSSIFIWNEIPTKDNVLPDVVLGANITFDEWGRPGTGRVGMNQPMSAATDGKRLFVADHGNNRILVWNEMPAKNQTPADLVLGQPDFESTEPGNTLDRFEHPTQISTDGKRLVVAEGNGRVLVWKSLPTRNRQPADFEIKVINHSAEPDWTGIPQHARLALPAGAYVHDGRLFVADTGNNRVLGWSRFPESRLDEPDIVLGQKDFAGNYPSNSKSGLFVPAYINFDGSFLWVGETKWSNRLLRYSVQSSE